MKVGVLTFHEIYNPGAFLQALGTCTLLREMGHDPWIIDYTAPAHRFSVWPIVKNWRLWRHPVTIAEVFGRHAAFQRAQEHLPCTRKLLTHAEVARERFDAVLIGADIVWDHQNSHLGCDPVYFGKYLNTDCIISFAASCGPVSAQVEPPAYVREGLRQFQSFSVRDENSREFVRRYAGRDATLLCDPAFHLHDERHAAKPTPDGPYLLVYAMPDCLTKPCIERTRAYARKQNWQTVTVCYRQRWADRNHICIGPHEWLGWVQAAEAVVTNTFHGALFSIKSGAQFVVENNEAVRNKLPSLMRSVGLEDRILQPGADVAALLEKPWPVEEGRARIQHLREEARTFLTRAGL